jgi:hypothetical protein
MESFFGPLIFLMDADLSLRKFALSAGNKLINGPQISQIDADTFLRKSAQSAGNKNNLRETKDMLKQRPHLHRAGMNGGYTGWFTAIVIK